jgi:hypothetical protein
VYRLAILSLIAALAVSACGGNSATTTENVSFPPVHERDGRALADVKSQAEAVRFCVAALLHWPDAYSAYDKVAFDIPGPHRNYVCKKNQ